MSTSDSTNSSHAVLVTDLRRVDAEILEGVESNEDVADVGVHLQLFVPLLQVPDDRLLQEEGGRESGVVRRLHPIDAQREISALNLTSSRNSRFTRSSSGQPWMMRVLRVLIRSCLR